MSITLDKQPLPLTVADVEGGDTIAFEETPDRVFLVTTITLDESAPGWCSYLSTDLTQREDGSDNCRLIVDLVSGLACDAHFTEVCSKVNIASAIV